MPKRINREGEIAGYWLSKRGGSEMYYRTWFDPESRQTRRASLGTDDLGAAGRALAEWITTNVAPRQADPREVTLGGVFARYYQAFGRNRTGASAQRISLRMVLDEVSKGMAVAELTVSAQREIVRALERKGYAKGTIKRAFGAAKAAVNWAWKEGEIDKPLPFIILGDGVGRERVLSIGELANMWSAEMPDHLRVFLALAIGTAARPQALLELRRSQCDLERRVINLNPPGRVQTKKRRPLLPMALWLVPWIERANEHVVEFRGKSVQKIAGAFQTMRDNAGFGRDVTAYTIRHSIATELAVRGVSEIEIASVLGHYMPNVRTTGKYIHFSPDYLLNSRRTLEHIGADIAKRASKPITPEAMRASCVPQPTWSPNDHLSKSLKSGAGEGIRTLDPNLGKVVLYP